MKLTTDEPKRRSRGASDDEREFWDRWPKASRYYSAEDRSMYEAHLPGWHPECDLGGVIREAMRRDRTYRAPLWHEWPKIRREWEVGVRPAPLGSNPPEAVADQEFVVLMRAQEQMAGEGRTPKEVIVAIEPAWDGMGARGQAELRAHLVDLYRFGEEWPIKCLRVRGVDTWWLMPDGSKVPFTHPDYSLVARQPSEGVT